MKSGFLKFMTYVLSICILVSSLGFYSVFAEEEAEYIILDVSSASKITAANSALTAESKIVKSGSKRSARWSASAERQIDFELPEDLTPYTELAFSVYAETDCTVYISVNSDNPATENNDYYGALFSLTQGWQDVSIDISKDLAAQRSPKGYNFADSLSFNANGWRQTNDFSTMVLYFDTIKLVNNPSYGKLSPAPTENIGTKVLYNNDFNDEVDIPSDNISVSSKTNRAELVKEGENTYIKLETLTSDNCHIDRGDIKSESTWFVMDFDLRTDSGFSGNIQYKDATEARGTGTLINFDGYDIKISKNVIGTLEKGKWTNIKIVFDILNLRETVYINDDVAAENVSYGAGAGASISLLRLYVGSNQEAGLDIRLDNFKIYEGNKLRDIGDEQPEVVEEEASDGLVNGTYKADASAKDVEMKHPKLSQIGNATVLMIDTSSAYAKGELTKVDTANEAVVPVIQNSRTLVPVRFISESFDAEVSWDEAERKVTVVYGGNTISLTVDSNIMSVNGVEQIIDTPAVIMEGRTMLPLRALVEALGKNVLWDSRGLIVITEPDVNLDAEADVKLSTMLIGYLKTGTLAENYAAYPAFTQSVIDEACAAPLGAYTSDYTEVTENHMAVKALYYLGLVVRSNPEARASDGTLCKDAALAQLRSMITGGNEPPATCGPHWTHGVFAADLVLVKNTPALYNELTDEEKERMDCLMFAFAVAGNWGYNDQNFYITGFDLAGNFGKTYNPNYRNTYCSIVLSAIMYFGAEELDNRFVNFSYDKCMADFEKFGFTNMIEIWQCTGKDLMENGGECTLLGGYDARYTVGQSGGYGVGVKVPFVYNGMTSDNIIGIFSSLVSFTYSFKVISGFGTVGAKDHTYILTGKASPYQGQMGMMREFASSDGGGIRSSISYVSGSFRILMAVYTNMKLFGGWDSSDATMRKLDNRAYVGNEDFIFKASEGYYSYQSGHGGNAFEADLVKTGYKMDKDIWRNFHLMDNYEVEIAKAVDPAIEALEKIPEASPKDGVTTSPEGAYASTLYESGVSADSYYKLDGDYTKATVEFDAVIGSEATDYDYNCVIVLDTVKDGGVWKDFNMLIQFNKGTINVMNGGGYTNSSVRVGANYRYHFKIEFDTALKKYSVWVTEIYPEAGSTIQIADNFDFRSSATAIDAVNAIAVAQNYTSPANMWLENFNIIRN